MDALRLPLLGLGGEPVDLARTLRSHGVASLPPMWQDGDGVGCELTVPVPSGRPRTVRIAPGGRGEAVVIFAGRPPGSRTATAVEAAVRHVLRLDEDLSDFYSAAARDPELHWVTTGAGRMVRSASVFEEVIKTIATTNCAWSATERMVHALVEHLGAPSPTAPAAGPRGRAFPTPEAMAAADPEFYAAVTRAGYRGRYFIAIAEQVATGELDLEALHADSAELPDEELEARLRGLPGVGPYAAAHIMMMLGRYSRLILDSWTRPTYARLVGRKTVADSTILRRFRRYGPYAGLAFWLFLTRGWVAERAP